MAHLLERKITTFFLVAFLSRDGRAILGIPDFVEFGSCFEMKIMKNFDPLKYQGLWFDIRRVPNEYLESVKCISQNYTWTGSAIDVIANGLTEEGEQTIQLAVMTADQGGTVPPEENQAFMYVTSDGVPKAPYKVVWTDYVSTACVYSCMNYYGMVRAEFAWIISRSENPSKESIQKCLDLFTFYDVDVNKIISIEQGETCSYYKGIKEDRKKTQRFLKKVQDNLSSMRQQNTSPLASDQNRTTEPTNKEGKCRDMSCNRNRRNPNKTKSPLPSAEGKHSTAEQNGPEKTVMLCLSLLLLLLGTEPFQAIKMTFRL